MTTEKKTIGMHEVKASVQAINDIVAEGLEDEPVAGDLSAVSEAQVEAELIRLLAVAGVEVSS